MAIPPIIVQTFTEKQPQSGVTVLRPGISVQNDVKFASKSPFISLSIEAICPTGQEQGRHVEPQGPEEAALQEDATGALCQTCLSVSPPLLMPQGHF